MRFTAILMVLVGSVLLAGPVSAKPSAPAAHTLDAQDVNAWLDGYMPYALHSGDIAGAVVVVVMNGQVLTERGYGYANVKDRTPVDPEKTLFRLGSLSKPFTWTAVMQLVEQGKLNLDADINTYLDFKVPLKDGKPVTLRNLMTHTAGFESWNKRFFVANQSRLGSLHDFVKHVPQRIYPAGTIIAYSNYGATLAGYIVQRVSGEAFDAYIAHHIFQPLGMAHSTFAQPLPASLAPDMANGYSLASGEPEPFEFVNGAPAGALSATGSDLARFMIAHLQDGKYGDVQILKPETAQLMHTTAFTPDPPLPGMALGFYHEDRNGHPVIAHAGDTQWFHSEMHLFLNDGVGIFVSISGGKPFAAQLGEGMRSLLYRGFADRYFPAPAQTPLPTVASARHDAALMAGRYVNSLQSESNFMSILAFLGATTVKALPDGTVEVSSFKAPGGALKKWREIGPMLWQEVGGVSRMAATVENGRVATFRSDDDPPVEVQTPVPASLNASWMTPLFQISLAIQIVCVVVWPISAVVRRRYGQKFSLNGRAAMLYRLVRLAAAVDLVLLVCWIGLFASLDGNLGLFDIQTDPLLRLFQVIGILAIVGAVVAVWNLVTVWRDSSRSWWAKLSSLLLAGACMTPVWFILALHLITVSLDY